MKLEVCQNCPIYNDGFLQSGVRKTCKVNPRFVSNPDKRRILIIAEAPGENEDRQNSVLVGRSGKLLDQLLQETGLDKYDIKIDNPVKCRPIKIEDGKHKNRTPTDKEIESCRPYLTDTLAFNPDFIILLGRIPFKTFFPDKEPALYRGKGLKYNYNGRDIMALLTYHPAACLYQASNKPTMLLHLQNAASYLNELQ